MEISLFEAGKTDAPEMLRTFVLERMGEKFSFLQAHLVESFSVMMAEVKDPKSKKVTVFVLVAVTMRVLEIKKSDDFEELVESQKFIVTDEIVNENHHGDPLIAFSAAFDKIIEILLLDEVKRQGKKKDFICIGGINIPTHETEDVGPETRAHPFLKLDPLFA